MIFKVLSHINLNPWDSTGSRERLACLKGYAGGRELPWVTGVLGEKKAAAGTDQGVWGEQEGAETGRGGGACW